MQTPELFVTQEQERAPGSIGVKEILSVLPEARPSSGIEMNETKASSSNWLEHGTPNPGVGGSTPSWPARS